MVDNIAASVLDSLESVKSSVVVISSNEAEAMSLASHVLDNLRVSLDTIEATNIANLRDFIMMMPNNVCRYIWTSLLSDEGLAKIAFQWKTDVEFCDFLKRVYSSK